MSQDVVKLNIGGVRYEVARSLLNAHPDTMLAKSASKQWHKDPSKEIFMERDGERFRYILDYLRDCQVYLPVNISKQALLLDFEYYGFTDVNKETVHDMDATTFLFAKSTIRIADLVTTWQAKITKNLEEMDCMRRVIFRLECSEAILDAFIKKRSGGYIAVVQFQRTPQRSSVFLEYISGPMKWCNEYLRLAGIQVVDGPLTKESGKLKITSFRDKPDVTIHDVYIELCSDAE